MKYVCVLTNNCSHTENYECQILIEIQVGEKRTHEDNVKGGDSANKKASEIRVRSDMFGPKSFSCKTCKKIFNAKSELEKHEEKHDTGSSTGEFKCGSCDRVCSSQESLKDHTERRHPNKDPSTESSNATGGSSAAKPFKCKTCYQVKSRTITTKNVQ